MASTIQNAPATQQPGPTMPNDMNPQIQALLQVTSSPTLIFENSVLGTPYHFKVC